MTLIRSVCNNQRICVVFAAVVNSKYDSMKLHAHTHTHVLYEDICTLQCPGELDVRLEALDNTITPPL